MGRLARITRLSSTELFQGDSACLNRPEVALADKAASFSLAAAQSGIEGSPLFNGLSLSLQARGASRAGRAG